MGDRNRRSSWKLRLQAYSLQQRQDGGHWPPQWSTVEAKAGSPWVKARLVYISSSRSTKAIQWDSVLRELKSKHKMGRKTLVILPIDWWPAPGHSSATWHSLSWSWRKWIGNKLSKYSRVLSCVLPVLCEDGIITIIITLNNYGWKLWFKERDRKKLMSLLFSVWDAMFAQCCDKGNCHFSDWGQERLYRRAHLGFHLLFLLLKTHSFISSFTIYLCVHYGECMTICVWLYVPVYV